MGNRSIVRTSIALFCVLFFAYFLCAQQVATSALTGTVTDTSGAVVGHAKVTLISQATQFKRTTTANGDGLYAFSELTPGFYTVVVEAGGFKSVTIQGLQFHVGQSSIQDVHLNVGAVTESVTVSASSAPLLQQSDATVGTVIEEKTLTEI